MGDPSWTVHYDYGYMTGLPLLVITTHDPDLISQSGFELSYSVSDTEYHSVSVTDPYGDGRVTLHSRIWSDRYVRWVDLTSTVETGYHSCDTYTDCAVIRLRVHG